MNVMISNKQIQLLSSLNIDVLKDVKGEYSVEEIVAMFEKFFYERMILDVTAIKNYQDIKTLQSIPMHLDANKIILVLDGSPTTTSNEYISKLVSMGIYNFTQNKEGIEYLLKTPNSYRDVARLQILEEEKVPTLTKVDGSKMKVLGIKNLTSSAGSTSLVYMLKKQLSESYNVFAIEIDKNDFIYFNDKNMISTTSVDLGKELLKLSGSADIVLIDLNSSNGESACNDILYLIEPSIIKMNQFVAKNKETLEKLATRKVVLNRSLLSPKDIEEFEMEAGIKIFYNIPPLNDRENNLVLNNLLVKLGFLKQRLEDAPIKQNKLFGIFGRNN